MRFVIAFFCVALFFLAVWYLFLALWHCKPNHGLEFLTFFETTVYVLKDCFALCWKIFCILDANVLICLMSSVQFCELSSNKFNSVTSV